MTTEEGIEILLVDDEQIIHDTLGAYLRQLGHRVDGAFDGREGVESALAGDYGLVLLDVRMPAVDGLEVLVRLREQRPELAVVLMTGHGDMEMAVRALRLGAADFLPKPVRLLDLDAAVARARYLRELNRDRTHLREVVRGLQQADEKQRRMIGDSEAMMQVRQHVRQAVEGGADSILITGETGTGKEVVAREIHETAAGDELPFIAVSCPSLPESLVESELFGHVKGSFTGATRDRAGAFELADGGTLFLDEIGDLSAAAQASLLRVLETRSLRRVGGTKEIDVEVRVIAATNGNLTTDGGLRQDLLYRLNLFPIHLTPLRERRADIEPLATHFQADYARRRRLPCKGFTDRARAALQDYDFPGNVRELRNVVERAAIVARGVQIDVEHLALQHIGLTAESAAGPGTTGEEARVVAALEAARWNRRDAARRLGMAYSTLRYKINKYGIS